MLRSQLKRFLLKIPNTVTQIQKTNCVKFNSAVYELHTQDNKYWCTTSCRTKNEETEEEKNQAKENDKKFLNSLGFFQVANY